MSLSEALHRTDERDSEIATLLAPPQLGFTQGSSASSGPTKPHGRTHGSRMWWNELLLYLEGDSRFSAALQASVEQGEAAYRRYVRTNRALTCTVGCRSGLRAAL